MATNEEILAKLEEIKSRQNQHTESVCMLTVAITGSVDGSVKGLNQQVAENTKDIESNTYDIDELEEAEKQRKNWTISAILTALGAAATALWNILTGSHGS